ncbi:MAG: dihydroorotase [Myxococcales bacterium]|nr:dihydroorotase [Myxococcales bacterium]
MRQLTLTLPDDWHLHLRDGAAMTAVTPDTAHQFGRAIVMPNLKPPVVNTEMAHSYRERICAAVPEGTPFNPLMTLYLTDRTTPEEIALAGASPHIYACKLYPAGATTNSDAGVTDIAAMGPVFDAMAEAGLLLLLHGEVTDKDVDIFERETVYLDRVLAPLLARHPTLKVVLEHITTAAAVQFILAQPARIAATITAHHLRNNRNAMLAGGIRPHLYCLPILKRESDRQALLQAATSGDPRFFLGTDSAPHAIAAKESVCGCAGSYTAHAALAVYAEAFDSVGKLDQLEGFASFFGPDFYGMKRNTETLTLVEQPWQVPERLAFGDQEVRPFAAGEQLRWQVRRTTNP